jgi:ComEC/Rec2-related protein
MPLIYYFTATYLISLIIFFNCSISLIFSATLCTIYIGIAVLLAIKGKKVNIPIVLAGGLIWGLFVSSITPINIKPPDISQEEIVFDGYIIGSPDFNRDSTVYTVDVERYILNERLNISKFTLRYIASLPFADPMRGDLIRARCRVSKGEDGDLICFGKAGEPPIVIEREGFGILNAIDEYRKHITEFLFKNFLGEISNILVALSTGNSKAITYDIRRIFAQSGTSHILAISGTHIGLISVLVYYILKALLFPLTYIRPVSLRKASSLLLIPILILVAFYFGGSPSVVRAVVMIVVFLISIIVERERDVLSSIFLAFILITSFSASSIKDIGFQLSFASVVGIVISIPSFLKRGIEEEGFLSQIIGYLKISFFTSLFATFFTAPLTAYHFGIVSLSGIIANLVIVPFTGMITLPLICFGVITNGFSTAISTFFFNGAFVSIEHLLRLNELFASIPFSYVKIFRPSYVEIGLFYMLLLVIIYRDKIPFKRLFIPSMIVVLILSSLIVDRIYNERLRSLMLVRKGALLYIDDDRKSHLILDGNATKGDLIRAVSFLHSRRITRVNYSNLGSVNDLYIRDHLYIKDESDRIVRSSEGDILIKFKNHYVYIFNNTSSCPPESARFVISRRVSKEAVEKLKGCNIQADRLIFAGRARNPELIDILYEFYKEDAQKILICKEEDCEIVID